MKTADRNLFPHHPPLKPPPDPCTSFCNPSWNFFRGCPPLCVPLCPAFCQPFPDFLHSPEPPSPSSIHTAATDHHHHHHHPDYFSPVFIAMIVLLASAFTLVVSYLIYSTLFSSLRFLRQRQRSSPVPEEFDQSSDMLNFHPVWYITTVGLQRSTVESIGVCEYNKSDGLVQGTACVVCLAEFQDGDALRLLPKCCHAFHVPCIDTWFASHTTCPVCRTPVLQGSNIDLQPPRVEARLVEIVDDPSPSGEVASAIAGEADGGGEGEAWRPMRRRAASMDSLGVEVGEKMNTCASGSNSLGERSLSCTGKLLSSSRHGLR